jgi:hypothetical protein
MRRSIALVLATMLSLLLILPALVHSADSSAPPCCRKNGKHHCTMLANERSVASASPALTEKCTQFPHSSLVAHLNTFAAPVQQATYAGLVRHPAVCPQTEAGYRISCLRTEQKRGPPARFFQS